MKRRDILKASAIFLGYGLAGGASLAVLNGCKADTSTDWKPKLFSMQDIDMLAEVAERIIPKTDTPGAKDALVHRYLDDAIRWNYSEEDQKRIKNEIQIFDKMAKEAHGKSYKDISDEDKDSILQQMEDIVKVSNENGDGKKHIYSEVKSLVVGGYFTSEEGATQTLIYDPVPGPYQGCIPLSEVGGVYAL